MEENRFSGFTPEELNVLYAAIIDYRNDKRRPDSETETVVKLWREIRAADSALASER